MNPTDSRLEFRLSIARLLSGDPESPAIRRITDIAWETSFQKKEARIESIEAFIGQNQSDEIMISGKSYDVLELIVSLSHYRRAAGYTGDTQGSA